ncbi:MAG: ferredoxin [Pseudomonadota bacterium]
MEPAPPLQKALIDGAKARGLRVNGGFHPTSDDGLHPGIQSVVLMSPGPDFWSVFTASHEYQGGHPDPMDRWSRRVLGRWACELGAKAYFPFTTDPIRPFFQWALRSGRAWASPVTLLVDDENGLMTSYRGAIGLRERLDFTSRARPCDRCEAPCGGACPVGALTIEGYDVPRCITYLRDHPTSACRQNGCQVRLSCPVATAPAPEHAQFHMSAFIE